MRQVASSESMSHGDFATWFKAPVADFHGMDLEGPPPSIEVAYELNA